MNYPLALRNGTLLAEDYRIEGILGAGGSGITYVAREISLNRDIAIKEYFPSDFAIRQGDSEVCARTEADREDYVWGLDRFIEEAQTLAKFDHSNIVRVFRYFQTHNTAYMVLKLEEGRNLKTWLAELQRPPSQQELDAILKPLLDALELIHSDNFLHRDIAPDNIVIREDGSPVLIDFGSARRVISSRPKTVSALIKPGYSPFEQYAMTGKDQGPWTDIYSLAATLYHAVTGKRPLDSPTRMVGDELVPAVKAASDGYRKSFLKAIDMAMKLKTRERPQSIPEWRENLFIEPSRQSMGAKKQVGDLIRKMAEPSAEKLNDRKKEKAVTVVTQKKKKVPTVLSVATEQVGSAPSKKPRRINVLQRASRGVRRAFIKFLAEYARPEKNESLQKAGSLVSRLGEMRLGAGSEKTLEEQVAERQSETLKAVEAAAEKKKSGIIGKILARPQEEEAEKKPEPAPNKSFAPQENPETVQHEDTTEVARQEQKLVTVRLNRKKISVEPGPTTQARARLRDRQQDNAKPEKRKRKFSKLSLALRTMQFLMIAAIVLPLVYFLNIENETVDSGKITGSISNPATIIQGHNNVVTAVSFTSDGTRIVSSGYDNNVRVWDSVTGQQLHRLNAHRDKINALDVYREVIVSADARGEMILWNLDSGKPVKNFRGHDKSVSAVVFSGSGQNIFSGSTDGKIRFWNSANTRREQYEFQAHNSSIRAIAYSDNRRLIASVGSERDIKLWNLTTGRLIRSYPAHDSEINALAISPSGNSMASGGRGEIGIWSTRSRKLYRSIKAHNGSVTALVFSPDGRWLATAGEDRQIQVWNWRTGELVKTFSGHTAAVNAVSFSPDGKRLASAGQDYSIRLWKIPVGLE